MSTGIIKICKIKLFKEYFFQFIAILMFFLLIFMKVSPSIKSICEIVLMGLGVILLIYSLSISKDRNKIIIYLLFIIILAFMNMVIAGSVDIKDILKFIIVHTPISLTIVYSKYKCPLLWKSLFWVVALFLLSRILFVDHYRIFYDTSSNMVSIYLIILLWLYEYQLCDGFKKICRPSIIYPVTVFILSVLSQGRMGILVSAFLLVMMVFSRYFLDKKENHLTRLAKQTVLVLILLISLIYIRINFTEIVAKYLPRFSVANSYDTASSNAIRVSFLRDYIKECGNIVNFLFGLDFSQTSHLASYEGGNVHNSYLMVHSYLGIFGLVLFLFVQIKSMKYLWESRQYYMFFTLVAFAIRIITDYCVPGNIGDIMWMCLIAIDFKNRGFKICQKELQ